MQYEEYLIYLRKSRSDASLEAMGVDVLERHEQILLDLATVSYTHLTLPTIA